MGDLGLLHRLFPVSQVNPTLCSGATPWPQSQWNLSSRCCCPQIPLLHREFHPKACSFQLTTAPHCPKGRARGAVPASGARVGENPLRLGAVSPGQVTGMQYLHAVLGPTISRVFEEKKYVELDPSKVEIKDVG